MGHRDPDGTPRPAPRLPTLLAGLLIAIAALGCQTAPRPVADLAPGSPSGWPERLDLPQPTKGTLAAAINRGLRQNRVAVVSATPTDGSVRFDLETLAQDAGWLEVTWLRDAPITAPADFDIRSEIGPFDDAPETGERLARSIRDRLDELWDKGHARVDRDAPRAPRAGVPLR